METTYTVTAADESYGPDCVDGRACAQAMVTHLVEYATRQEYEVEIRIVPETDSFGNRSTGDAEVIADLDRQSEDNWTEWVPVTAYIFSAGSRNGRSK